MQDVNKIQWDGVRFIVTLNDGKKYFTDKFTLQPVKPAPMQPISTAGRVIHSMEKPMEKTEEPIKYLGIWKIQADNTSGTTILESKAQTLKKLTEEKSFRDIVFYKNKLINADPKHKDFRNYYDFEEKSITFDIVELGEEYIEVMRVNANDKSFRNFIFVRNDVAPHLISKLAMEL